MSNSILAKMTVVIAGQNAQFLSAMDQATRKSNVLEKAIGSAGKALTVAFIANKAYQGLEYGVGVMKDFERQMDTVAAISGATGEDLKKLQDNAVNLAGAFRSIDIAKMETELARLGFSTGEIINSTKAIVDLATATGEDLAKSAEIVGSTLRAFQIDAQESGRVAEVMAIGFNTSALALDNFGEAMKYVAPVANAANLSLEQTTALLGVLADNGVKGSMAGTSLRKIISDLGQGAAPILNQRLKEMAAAGLSGADAMTEVGRTAYTSLLILANNTQKVEEAIQAQKTMKGTLAETAAIMQDNLQGDVDKLNAAWDRMFITGSGLIPIFRSLTQSTTSFVNSLSGAVAQQEQFERLLRKLQTNAANQGSFMNFGDEDVEVTKRDIKKLEELATAAGRQIGVVWDETGEKVKEVFAIDQKGLQEALNFKLTGLPKLESLSDSLKGILFYAPKATETVGSLKKQIEDLNDKIEASGSQSEIKKYQAEISGLQYKIEVLTGSVKNFSTNWDIAFDASKLDLSQFEIFKRSPFDDLQGFNDQFGAARGINKPDQLQNDWLDFLNPGDGDENDEFKKSMEQFDEWVKDREEGFAKAARAAGVFGDAIGDVLVSSLVDGENFGRALARQVDRAITELYRMAVGAQLAKNALDAAFNPMKAIIGLTVGFVALKTAFAAIQKSNASDTRSYGEKSVIAVSVDDRGLGQFLKAEIRNQDYKDGRTRA
ncbi:MAG TPA: phage tail tape measure protein [Cyclobacteriaceae bacterium]|nr:phage tail tape measure protein [Cyclobacteriaceae bacterium]